MFKNALAVMVIALAVIESRAQWISIETRHQLQLDQFMENFKRDSVKTMASLPTKLDARGFARQTPGSSKFSLADIDTKEFIIKKDQTRSEFCPDSLPGHVCSNKKRVTFGGFDYQNAPLTLLEGAKNLNVYALDVREGRVAQQPWSDYYWATYRGGLAFRYSDSQFPQSTETNWPELERYLTGALRQTDRLSSLDHLSPAEKYDLLVGDESYSLTRSQIRKSQETYDQFSRNIESWFGLCHGWAPASYMHSRPQKTVQFQLANGKQLRFFPSDIKALSTLAWATTSRVPQLFAGGRCDKKDPARDSTGRVIDSECWDANPGLWHATVVNRVGFDKRSFVFDVTFDYEVWNQPVLAYRMSYYNPQTQTTSQNIQEALIAKSDFTADPFARHRSPLARSIVGVIMDVDYMVETSPSANPTDSDSADSYRTVQFIYDLELDSFGNIVGGEWYQNAHPDFVWTPLANGLPLAPNEPLDLSWNRQVPVDRRLNRVAKEASESGSPLNTVVQGLIQLAR